MAANIKPIEAKSVHQIQSGQVIVDLCSVVKELVENALDAGATNIEVRFKNNGLDSIEVQDNGCGISESNYESVALKHYTSKLSTYDDLSTLQTFGFRGEALSSLCALSTFSLVTAQDGEAPKGKRLEFEISGKLKSTTLVATQKGTIAVVENIFDRLPVRRKELSKNIKREYGKVLGLLQAYACISTRVKFVVKNSMPKGKGQLAFSTKGNSTTRENIANVYGAKTLAQLIEVNLQLGSSQRSSTSRTESAGIETAVKGHISSPVYGEGRQTPDRQMFFVNGRPCGLPQMAKAVNEVYKSYNVSQSPFIFADFRMDTNNYDVNVSPDKRTIFLHNAASLIEGLREKLTELFDNVDQTVPQSSIQTSKLPSFRPLTVQQGHSENLNQSTYKLSTLESSFDLGPQQESPHEEEHGDLSTPHLFREHFGQIASTRPSQDDHSAHLSEDRQRRVQEKRAEKIGKSMAKHMDKYGQVDEYDDVRELSDDVERSQGEVADADPVRIHVPDFNARIAEEEQRKRQSAVRREEVDRQNSHDDILSTIGVRKDETGVVQRAFDHMRPRRAPAEVATITIGDKTITTMVGTQLPGTEKHRSQKSQTNAIQMSAVRNQSSRFSQNLRRFDAAGFQNAYENSPDQKDGTQESISGHSITAEDEDREIFDKTSMNGNDDTDPDSSASETTDPTYVDEAEEKAAEEARVAMLIQAAEEAMAQPSMESQRRATQALKSGQAKDATTSLVVVMDIPLDALEQEIRMLHLQTKMVHTTTSESHMQDQKAALDAEQQLALTVSKDDFSKMRIAGQFNLGFIIATRPSGTSLGQKASMVAQHDELFIIDQHASDEKYNFERLQAETIVGNQRLVHPVSLDLTAVEEEVILENAMALEKNGFLVELDASGDRPVGERCKLVSLPLSREVVFNTRDLDELIHLLAETPMISNSTAVPRPSKVRKMFAMRACRSSIMIGKTLSKRQMSSILQHMGSIDKPWNCPHGRPTMRHLLTLDNMDQRLWHEGDGVSSVPQDQKMSTADTWRQYTA